MADTYWANPEAVERFRRALESESIRSVYTPEVTEANERMLFEYLIADAMHYARHTGPDARAIFGMAHLHFEAEVRDEENEKAARIGFSAFCMEE